MGRSYERTAIKGVDGCIVSVTAFTMGKRREDVSIIERATWKLSRLRYKMKKNTSVGEALRQYVAFG